MGLTGDGDTNADEPWTPTNKSALHLLRHRRCRPIMKHMNAIQRTRRVGTVRPNTSNLITNRIITAQSREIEVPPV